MSAPTCIMYNGRVYRLSTADAPMETADVSALVKQLAQLRPALDQYPGLDDYVKQLVGKLVSLTTELWNNLQTTKETWSDLDVQVRNLYSLAAAAGDESPVDALIRLASMDVVGSAQQLAVVQQSMLEISKIAAILAKLAAKLPAVYGDVQKDAYNTLKGAVDSYNSAQRASQPSTDTSTGQEAVYL